MASETDDMWLDLTYRRGRFGISWFDDENGEGAALGGDSEACSRPAPPLEDQEAWENWTAEKIACASECECDAHGFSWETEARAKRVLVLIKKEFVFGAAKRKHIVRAKAAKQRPHPQWAQTALAEGWTPPKGWKPWKRTKK